MRVCLPVLGLLSLFSVACGGADEGRFAYVETETEDPEPCDADRGYESFSLVDFEPHELAGGDTSINVQCNPELASSCDFYFNYDSASSPPNPTRGYARGDDCLELAVDDDAEVMTSPRVGQSTFEAQEIPEGRCGEDGYGLNIVTENVGMCYGADGRLGWGAALDVTFSGPPLDARDWDGIAFWVRKGEGGSQKPAIIVQFVDPNTSGTEDPETGEPATCDASDPALGEQPVPDSEKCDAFGTAVTLTDDWSFVATRFEDLAQKGFGVVSPLGHLKLDEINRMQIFMSAGSANFWLDDIALFREEATE